MHHFVANDLFAFRNALAKYLSCTQQRIRSFLSGQDLILGIEEDKHISSLTNDKAPSRPVCV